MKLWRQMATLPQPLQGLLRAYMVIFALVFVSMAISFAVSPESGDGGLPLVMRLGFGLVGAAAAVLGLVLATDYRGSAGAYGGLAKDYRIMGVDFSESAFAKPLFIRLLGAGLLVIGVVFVVVAALK